MKKIFDIDTITSYLPFLKGKSILQPLTYADASLNTYLNTSGTQQQYNTNYGNSSINSRKVKQFFKNSKYLPFVIVIVLVGMILFLSVKIFSSHSSSAVAGATDQRITVQPPLKQETLNKTFSFPLKDANSKVVSQLQYVIQNAELRDQIIVQGQQATSVKGRAFLILNLKITNSFDQSVKINARDYVRLIINDSSDRLAPNIHNDPVEVQAISTQYTRLGFPIDENYKSLVLQVGEITGTKQLIPLDLK